MKVVSVVSYYVYILTNKPYGTFYVGVTNDLIRRVYEHKEGVVEGFTKKHGIDKLVWYEVHEDITQAIQREKSIKRWKRDFKINVIKERNSG